MSAAELPSCYEMRPLGVVTERGAACSRVGVQINRVKPGRIRPPKNPIARAQGRDERAREKEMITRPAERPARQSCGQRPIFRPECRAALPSSLPTCIPTSRRPHLTMSRPRMRSAQNASADAEQSRCTETQAARWSANFSLVRHTHQSENLGHF